MSLHNQALLLLGSDDVDQQEEADSVAEDAIGIFRDLQEKDLEFIATNTLVMARSLAEGAEEALRTALDARDRFRLERDRSQHEAAILVVIANLQSELEQPEAGLRAAEEARQLHKQAGDKRGEASALQAIALIHSSAKQMDQAKMAMDEMRETYISLGDRMAEASTLLQMADLVLVDLMDQVEEDTKLENEKKEVLHGIKKDDVYQKGFEGIAYAAQAMDIYNEMQDHDGQFHVRDFMDAIWKRISDMHADLTVPSRKFIKTNQFSTQTVEEVELWHLNVPTYENVERTRPDLRLMRTTKKGKKGPVIVAEDKDLPQAAFE